MEFSFVFEKHYKVLVFLFNISISISYVLDTALLKTGTSLADEGDQVMLLHNGHFGLRMILS